MAHHISLAEITDLNPGAAKDNPNTELQANQRVTMPCSVPLDDGGGATATDGVDGVNATATAGAACGVEGDEGAASGPLECTYRAKPGDSLETIAAAYHITMAEVADLNPQVAYPKDKLSANQKVNVPCSYKIDQGSSSTVGGGATGAGAANATDGSGAGAGGQTGKQQQPPGECVGQR